MSKKTSQVVKESKRFVLSKKMVGEKLIISVTTKTGKQFKYDHDSVYSINQEKLESMECWHRYGNYTNSNNLPTWARECEVK